MITHEIITENERLAVYFDIYKTDNHIVPSHWHAHLEILYILEGGMHIICNEKKYDLTTGDLFVVNSGAIHYTHSMNHTRILLLQVPYELLSQSITQFSALHFEEYLSKKRWEQEPDLQEIIHYLKKMQELYQSGEDGYPFLFRSALNLFLHLLYTKYSVRQTLFDVNKEEKNMERLRKIVTYIEEHYAENLALSEVAKEFALNPEYFCRYFKKNIGFTFLEYVNMVRLSHIHRDILQTSESIMQIQERHGFSNYKVFNRMFKEIYGCTPSEARRNVK